jgi:hypothetical protein
VTGHAIDVGPERARRALIEPRELDLVQCRTPPEQNVERPYFSAAC